MIIVLSFLINLFAPIVNTLGAIGLCACIVYDDFHILWIGGALAVAGFIFGMLAYRNGIPPRWFWSKSADAIFSFSVTAVLGYAWNFAAWPFTVYLVSVVSENI